jgi:hypothetical protein
VQPQTGKDDEEDKRLQSKSAGSVVDSVDAGEEVEAGLSQSKGGGSPLPESVRTYMEPRFGVSFDHVRVHTGSNAIQMNRDVGAQAFTHGADIYYGAGSSPTNLELTAHELAHVIQQGGALLRRAPVAMPVSAATVAQRAEAAVTAPAEATADAVVCPICGRQGKGYCFGCDQPLVPAQRLAITEPPTPAGLDRATVATPAAATTAAPPVQQRTDPAIHRLGLGDVVSLGRDAAISLIGRYSPGLAEFIRNGPMAMLVETIKRGVQNWLRGLLGGVNIGGAISGLVSSLTSAFAAIRESDNPACATLAASIDGLRKLGQAVMDSPAIKIAQAIFSTVAGVFQKISDVIIGGAFDTVMGIVGGVTDMAKTIWGWIVTAKDALGMAWDTVKKKIGLDDDENGIIAKLKAKAAEGWEAIKSGIAPLVGPLKTLLKLMLVFSPVGPTILMIKYLPPLVETVQWLWAHKGDTDIIKSSEEAGHTVLPKLLRAVQGFSQGVQEVASALVKGATELHEAVLTVMGVITGLPLLSIAQGLMQALANGVQQLVTMAQTGIEAAAAAIGELFQKAKKALQPFIDVLVPLGMCIVNPTMIPIILGGKAWLALNDCYKEPIIDFLLDIAIGLLKKAPDVSMFGPLWKVLRQGVIGFLEGVRGKDKDEKIRITNKLAKIMSGGNPDFMVGFAKGLLIGLWKGLVSPFELVYDLIKLLNHVQAWAEKAGGKTLDQALAPASAAPGAVTVGAAAGPVPVPATAAGRALAPATPAAPAAPAAPVATPAAPTATKAAPPTSSGNGASDPGQAALQQKLGQLVREVGPPVKEVTANFMPAMQETFTSGDGITYADVKNKLGSLMTDAEMALHTEGERLADIACKSFLNDANDAQLGEDVGNISGQIIFEIILLVLTEGLIEALKPLQGIAKMLDFVGEAIGAGIKWLGKIGGWVVDGVKGLWKFVENSGAGKKVVQALQNIGEILMRYADELLGLVGKKTGREAAEALGEKGAKEAAGAAGQKAAKGAAEKVTVEIPVQIGKDPHSLKVVDIEGKKQIWLCSDHCGGITGKIKKVREEVPEALQKELDALNDAALALEKRINDGTISADQIPDETKRLADKLRELSGKNPELKALTEFEGPLTREELVSWAKKSENQSNYRRTVDPTDIRGAKPGEAAKSGHSGSKHKVKPEVTADIVNNPDKVFTGVNENGFHVDIYYKDGSIVVTPAGQKHVEITTYGKVDKSKEIKAKNDLRNKLRKEGKNPKEIGRELDKISIEGTPVPINQFTNDPRYVEVAL